MYDMYKISHVTNKRMFDPTISSRWEDERLMFEDYYKNLEIKTKHTIKSIEPDRQHVPYLKTSIALKVNNEKMEKVKRISIIYYHGNAQNIFSSFTMLFEVLDNLDQQIPDELTASYDALYVDLICFEYPFYFHGDTMKYNQKIIESWDTAINYELRCLFDIKLPGERGSYETLEQYENMTGNMIISIGVSLGSGFLCRQFSLGSPSSFILVAPFASIRALADREAKKIVLGNTVMYFSWNDQTHEYFPNVNSLKTYIEGDKKVVILLSRRDELCGSFTDTFYSIENDNIKIIETLFTHDGFGEMDGLLLLAAEILIIIQNKENEKNQKKLEGTI